MENLINNFETNGQEQVSDIRKQLQNGQGRTAGPSESYPVESILECLRQADKVISIEGSSKPISKERISEILGKKIPSLGLLFSTWNQYNILTTVRGEGYRPTTLYRKYIDKTYPQDEREALMEIFRTPELYAKIIDNLDGHIIPVEEKFGNILSQPPYNINPNSCAKAAKAFYENIRDLGLLDRNNKFVFTKAIAKNDIPQENINQKPKDQVTEELFELPIPLGGTRKAYLKYPLADLSKKDIRVIRKALEFVESSILDEDTE